MQIISQDEMSNPFSEKNKKKKNFRMSSAEFFTKHAKH